MEHWELVARECCRDTLAQYTHAGDRFRLDEYVAAFCEDGILEIRGSEPLRGRAAIMDRFRGGIVPSRPGPDSAGAREGSGDSTVGVQRRIIRHNVDNVRFESVTPDEITVASYFTVFTNIGLDHLGRYRDRLVPVGERWLISHRFVSTDWRAADSLFAEAR
jgi:SnoaL-like domain